MIDIVRRADRCRLIVPLALVLATTSTRAADPPAQTVEATVERCLSLRRSEPQTAIALADGVLADPALAIEPRIKMLTCLGDAARIVGQAARAIDVANEVQALVEAHPELPPAFVLRALSHAGAMLHSAGRTYQAEQLYARVNDIAASQGGNDAIVSQIVTLINIGLIHADLVRENMLVQGDTVRFIDFDDSGFGYRIFDLATALLQNINEPDYAELQAALCEGYAERRSLPDIGLLPLFLVLRALTYVGWAADRMSEPAIAGRMPTYLATSRKLIELVLPDLAPRGNAATHARGG